MSIPMTPHCMSNKRLLLVLFLASGVILQEAPSAKKRPTESVRGKKLPPALWLSGANQMDIASRDVFYGPRGKEHEPHGTFWFIKEDLDGTSPKLIVKDDQGVKWNAKLGSEAQPETAASRLTWAVGFFAIEDYGYTTATLTPRSIPVDSPKQSAKLSFV